MGNTGKASNGNGGGFHDDHDDDDDPTPILNPLGNRENRRMLTILADYLTEAKTHSSKLESLYIALKEMTMPLSPIWAGTVLSEFERHHVAEGENLSKFRTYIQDPTNAGGMSVGTPGDDPDDED